VCEIITSWIRTYVGVEIQLHAFLTAALDGHDCCTSSTGCFSLDDGAGGMSLMWGWEDLTKVLTLGVDLRFLTCEAHGIYSACTGRAKRRPFKTSVEACISVTRPEDESESVKYESDDVVAVVDFCRILMSSWTCTGAVEWCGVACTCLPFGGLSKF